MLKRLTIRGSIVGTRKDLEEAIAFAAEGKVVPNVEEQPLEAINQVFARMKAGTIDGRIALRL